MTFPTGGGEDELIKELSLETVTGIIQCYKSSLQEETPRCLDRKKNKMLGLERWPSGSECVLFLQRTQFGFPEPSSCGSQPPVMPAGGDLKPSSSLLEHLPSKRRCLEKKSTKFQLVTKVILSFTGIVSAISNFSQAYNSSSTLKSPSRPWDFLPVCHHRVKVFPPRGGESSQQSRKPQTHFGRPLLPSPRAPDWKRSWCWAEICLPFVVQNIP